MPTVLIATASGCHAYRETGNHTPELPGHSIGPLEAQQDGTCLAIVDDTQVWQRSQAGTWSPIATADIRLQSILFSKDGILCGAMNEATILRIPPGKHPQRMTGFDHVPGRSEWFANGPPLGVRSLAKTSDDLVLMAAVHVGGIPRSEDGGQTWTPTIPILFDVHQVSTHPTQSAIAAAAAAVGLCVSRDQGRNWIILAQGLTVTDSFAVTFLHDEAIFSIQDGPFAKRSQVWRWNIHTTSIETVRNGLPEWLQGKVDSHQIATGQGRAALVDGGGNLWLSQAGTSGWKQIAEGLPYAAGLAIL